MSNDHTFDDIFVKQLEILLAPGDVVLVISGSGNSVNLIKAVRYAKARKAKRRQAASPETETLF